MAKKRKKTVRIGFADKSNWNFVIEYSDGTKTTAEPYETLSSAQHVLSRLLEQMRDGSGTLTNDVLTQTSNGKTFTWTIIDERE